MTPLRFLWRSWRFFARAHVAVASCVLLVTAVLAGALILGDSADHTLRIRALERLGHVEFALDTGPRQVRESLADDLTGTFRWPGHGEWPQVAPVLWAEGIAKTPDDRALANEVRVLGVRPDFWSLIDWSITFPSSRGWWLWSSPITYDVVFLPPTLADDEVVLGQPLAEQLGVKVGDHIVLVFTKPSPLPIENPLSDPRDSQASMLLTVCDVLGPDRLGPFALRPSATPPLNAFVSLATMQRALDLPGRANLLLFKKGRDAEPACDEHGPCPWPVGPAWRLHVATSLLRNAWTLDDAQLELRSSGDDRPLELRSSRVLLEEPVVRAAKAASPEWAYAVTTWFVNELRVGEPPRSTGVPPVSRMGVSPMQTLPEEQISTSQTSTIQTSISRPHANETATPYAEHERDARATGGAGETPATRGRSCPYSMVSAVERPAILSMLSPEHPRTTELAAAYVVSFGPLPTDEAHFTPLGPPMADDEIVINDWLADDLVAAVGDVLTLTYNTAEPGRKLVEKSRPFRVSHVAPMERIAADRELMPDFPGLADAESCRGWQSDWVDMRRVRAKDEAYWAEHRGTPKAFVSPAAAREMWGSSRGGVTAVRYGAGEAGAGAIERAILSELDPSELGLAIQPVREQMLASARQATDLGQLFLGLGGGVIAAALLLLWMVLSLSVAARSSQIRLMRAVGFSPRRARGLLLAEFLLPSVVGVAAGVAVGVVFARGLLAELGSSWSGAVGGALLELHVTSTSLAIAGTVSFAMAATSVWLSLRPHKARRDGLPVCAVECGGTTNVSPYTTPCIAKRQAIATRSTCIRFPLRVVVAFVFTVAAIVLAAVWSSPVSWFLAGAVVLLAGLVAARGLLRSSPITNNDLRSLRQLAWRNASRRAGPSFALVALLACAVFLILAVGAYRQQPGADASRRDSGTGGFALIGQSASPILGPLAPPGSPAPFEGVAVVPMRVRDGEDASCLNLNRPSQPRLLGVEPADLSRRGAFVFSGTWGATGDGWDVLDMPLGDAGETPSPRIVPGVADESTIRWSLHKRLGDVIEYSDEHGRPLRVRLVGQLSGSVLQGSVLISRGNFDEHFPSAGGFRFFLVDAPLDQTATVAADLSARHSERGLALVPASVRLSQLQAVENSYLSIFQVLSALGLVLGSAGLGLVVTRNIQDRRGELATMQAVGFSRRRLMALVLLEHAMLLALGLAVGVVAAGTALTPRWQARQELAGGHVAALLTVVLAVGFASTALAVRAGFHRSLVKNLRSE